MTDRKRIRTSPDYMTTNLDSVQICTWPRFLLVKGTDNERPLSKLSQFAVNTKQGKPNQQTIENDQTEPDYGQCYPHHCITTLQPEHKERGH